MRGKEWRGGGEEEEEEGRKEKEERESNGKGGCSKRRSKHLLLSVSSLFLCSLSLSLSNFFSYNSMLSLLVCNCMLAYQRSYPPSLLSFSLSYFF